MCEVVVYVVEPLGGEMILHLGIDDQLIKAIAPPSLEAKYGDRVWVEMDPDRLYLFDKKTEEALL
jgi:multiple sugar transport system ATP-binding protein